MREINFVTIVANRTHGQRPPHANKPVYLKCGGSAGGLLDEVDVTR